MVKGRLYLDPISNMLCGSSAMFNELELLYRCLDVVQKETMVLAYSSIETGKGVSSKEWRRGINKN